MQVHGYRSLHLEMGKDTPPYSTVRGWAMASGVGFTLKGSGRPSTLTAAEETAILNSAKAVRAQGGILDPTTLVVLAKRCLERLRPEQQHPPIGKNWVHSFRKRYNLGHLRRQTTDRPESTREQLSLDVQVSKKITLPVITPPVDVKTINSVLKMSIGNTNFFGARVV